jgi:TPR repeat protein
LTAVVASLAPAFGAHAQVDSEAAVSAPEELKPVISAANAGEAWAQFGLGLLYEMGRGGFPQSDTEAARWYRLAAEQGDSAGQTMLGVMYSQGRGVPQNDTEASRLFQLAADQGSAGAQTRLGIQHFLGQGVPESYVLAYKWLNLAAASGDARAIEFRDTLREILTPDQIAEAQKLSAEWKPISER